MQGMMTIHLAAANALLVYAETHFKQQYLDSAIEHLIEARHYAQRCAFDKSVIYIIDRSMLDIALMGNRGHMWRTYIP